MACAISTKESQEQFKTLRKYFVDEASLISIINIWRDNDIFKVDKFPSNKEVKDLLKKLRGKLLKDIAKDVADIRRANKQLKDTSKTSEETKVTEDDKKTDSSKKVESDKDVQGDEESAISSEDAKTDDAIPAEDADEASKQEELSKQKILRDKVFQEHRKVAIANREALDIALNPLQQRDRIQLLKSTFSKIVDQALNNNIEHALDLIDDAEIDNDKVRLTEAKEFLQELQGEYGRQMVIQQITPEGIFKAIKNMFVPFIAVPLDQRIRESVDKIMPTYIKRGKTKEEAQNLAVKQATKVISYRYKAFQDLINNYDALVLETIPYLTITEGIRISGKNVIDNALKTNVTINSAGEVVEENNAIEENEEAPKDNWMTDYTSVGSYDSLSKFTRKFISSVVKYDKEGKPEKDDLGQLRYLDSSYVHATLINKLRKMNDRKDLFPMLEDLAKELPWVNGLIQDLQLEENSEIVTALYIDMRKDFLPLWIQKDSINPDTGKNEIISIKLNSAEGTYQLLDTWRHNQEYGNILDNEYSIYDKQGAIDKEKATEGYKVINKIAYALNTNYDVNYRIDYALKHKPQITRLLNGLGISVNDQILEKFLTKGNKDDSEASDMYKSAQTAIKSPSTLNAFIMGIFNIYYAAKTNKINSSNTDDEYLIERNESSKFNQDIINQYSSAFDTIATALSEVATDAVESSIFENGKMRYSHLPPNALGQLIGNFTSKQEDYNKFLNKQYKRFSWFYKNGEYQNDWLKQMDDNPNLRYIMERKLIIHRNKKEYNDWTSLDVVTTLLHEYYSDPNTKAGTAKTAYYAMPIYSDAAISEFMKFTKFDDTTLKDEYGDYIPAVDIINDKLKSVVKQEISRITLVKARNAQWHIEYNKWLKDPKNEKEPFQSIKNYDMIDETQEKFFKGLYKQTKGGSEFKFFPSLNKDLKSTGTNLYDSIQNLLEDPTMYNATSIDDLLVDTIKEMMENNFKDAVKSWKEVGLFDTTESNKYATYKHLPNKNPRNTFELIGNQLLANKNRYIQDNLWNSEVEKVVDALLKGTNDLEVDSMNKVLQPIRDYYKKAKENGANISKIDLTNLVPKPVVNEAIEYMKNYFYNTTLATSQIIELTTTDLAYYVNLEDFQKRYKEVHSPALRLDTHAKFFDINKQEIVLDAAKETNGLEKTIYLQDNIVKTNIIDDLKIVFQEKVKNKQMTQAEMDKVINEYKNINETDAQAYRSLSSYRTLCVMSKDWNQAKEDTYNRIKNDEWDMTDLNTIWQTKKPFLYSQTARTTHLPNKNSDIDSLIKVPVQHKNSEFLLLLAHTIVQNAANDTKNPNSSRLRAIDAFMEKNKIDVVQFNSAVKVGEEGAIDLSSATTESEITDILNSKVFIKGDARNGINQDFVHTIDLEDYGIQVATPEHSIDAFQLLGTQIRKLIIADINENTKFNVGKSNILMSKKALVKEYNALITENIIESFAEATKIFKSIEKVEEILQSTIQGNPRYGTEIINACTLIDDPENPGKKKFNIPLSDPSISIKIQALLNSILRSRIVKQKVRGGALIQASGYGTSNQLHVVMEKDPYDPSRRRIKHIECYMPAYSKSFYEALMDENGQLDVEKLPDDLRKLIGYRVPTEDKYSMAPLYIKGFLPQQNGSAIMLPAEITTMSGSDFDVDKMFIYLPEFKVKKEIDDFKTRIKYLKEKENNKLKNVDTDDYKDWIKDPEKAIYKTSVHKIEYDEQAGVQNNSKQQRNNRILDIMWSILTNADTAAHVLTPGGFDEQKKAGAIVDILDNISSKDEILKSDEFKDIVADLEKHKSNDPRDKKFGVYEVLQKASLKQVERFSDKVKKVLDPLSPVTQMILHQRNVTGNKLIGIYANHNASNAIFQQGNVYIKSEFRFSLLGHNYNSLSSIENDYNRNKSGVTAGFLAASADNAKKPILASLNQDTNTADFTCLLLRLGYTADEIGLFVRQPIINSIIKQWKNAEYLSSKEKINTVKNLVAQYSNLPQLSDKDKLHYKVKQSIESSYADYIIENNTYRKDIQDYRIAVKNKKSYIINYKTKEFISAQITLGKTFISILEVSEPFSDLVSGMRNDANAGSYGPDVATNIIKSNNTLDVIQAATNAKKYPFAGVLDNLILSDRGAVDKIFKKDIENEQFDNVRKLMLSTNSPILTSFQEMGLLQGKSIFSKYFPHYNSNLQSIISYLKAISNRTKLSNKTVNNIVNAFMYYTQTNGETLGTAFGVTAEEKRKQYLIDFPDKFRKLLAKKPALKDYNFLAALQVVKPNKHNSISTLVLKNAGHITPEQKIKYTREWSNLLYASDPELNDLAIDLFVYSMMRSGLGFSNTSFYNLAPNVVKKATPYYIEGIEYLNKEVDFSPEILNNFVDLYIRNNSDDTQFCTKVDNNEAKINLLKGDKVLKYLNFNLDNSLPYDANQESTNDALFSALIQDTYAIPDIGYVNAYKEYFTVELPSGKKLLYRAFDPGTLAPEMSSSLYELVEIFGEHLTGVEYEYDRDPSTMTSVFAKNRISNVYDNHEEAKIYIVDSSSIPVSVNPTSIENTTDNNLTSTKENITEENNQNIKSNISEVTANNSFKDDTDKKICGS